MTLRKIACMCRSIRVIQGLLQAEHTHVCDSRAQCASWLYDRSERIPLTENQLQTLLSSGFVDWIADNFVALDHGDNMHLDHLSNLLARCPSNKSFFEAQRRLLLPNWDSYCKIDKVRMMPCAMTWSAETVRCLLDLEGPVQRYDIQRWDEEGLSLLQWSTMWFSCAPPTGLSPRFPRPREDWTGWQRLLTEIINATDDLHSMKTYDWRGEGNFCPWAEERAEELPATFLLCFFCVVDRCFIDRRVQISVEAKLKMLLGALMSCGIDLEAYGRREFDIWEHVYGSKHIRSISCVGVLNWNWLKTRHLAYGQWKSDLMVAIHYGPKLDDWIIEWDRCWDYPEVFWNMVENPLQVEVMPGSWVDTDEPYEGPSKSCLPTIAYTWR